MPKIDFEVRFECQADCSNCCTLSDGFVYLTEDEALQISEYLDVSETMFLEWFTRLIDEQLCLVDGENEACVFLDEGKCNIYPVRPEQCRTYPFWLENLKSRLRWKHTAGDCPGIGKGKVYTGKDITNILKGDGIDSVK